MKKNIVMGLLLSSLCIGHATESLSFSMPIKEIGNTILQKIRSEKTKKLAAAGAFTLVFAACARKTLAPMHPWAQNFYNTRIGKFIGFRAEDAKDINEQETIFRNGTANPNKAQGVIGILLAALKAFDDAFKATGVAKDVFYASCRVISCLMS